MSKYLLDALIGFQFLLLLKEICSDYKPRSNVIADKLVILLLATCLWSKL